MPWGTTTVSELRTAFVHAVRTAGQPVAAAARDFGISRKTAYKWLARFDAQQSLHDHSRKPHTSPTQTHSDLEHAVLGVRDQYGWGPRKIHAYLVRQGHDAPAIRTIADILRRHQRIARPTPPDDAPATQRFERDQPNELWQLDFKGWIEIARVRVSPLTILDDHSRFLLALRPCTDLTMNTAWNVLWDTLGEYGLPEQILCDNAFGTNGCPHSPGISWFESRLIRLGIRITHGRPYHPQTQGKVERLHGTLVREVYPRLDTTSLAPFTAGLDHWRQTVYNPLRPHEAIGDQPPVTRWRPSLRRRPAVLPTVEYPTRSILRRVGSNGLFEYRRARILAGQGLAGEPVSRFASKKKTTASWSPTRPKRSAESLWRNSGTRVLCNPVQCHPCPCITRHLCPCTEQAKPTPWETGPSEPSSL
jgi:transposase InsO family protein